MLVLTRKRTEQIVLPSLGVTVEVREIKRGLVRLGIDAPADVSILRAEISHHGTDRSDGKAKVQGHTAPANGSPCMDQLRTSVRTTGVRLGLLRLQLDTGAAQEARATLAELQTDLQLLLHSLEDETEKLPASDAIAQSRKQVKALLVEDNCTERELLAGFLRQSGLQVDTAGDGADALDYLRNEGKPDVLLLDMGLPRVDGPTTVREIRRDPACAGLTIFGVSGHRWDEFNLELGPAGVDRWFHKPFDPDILLRNVAAVLGPLSPRSGLWEQRKPNEGESIETCRSMTS